ncbi:MULTISPECIES: hypothetical protein [Anaeromyxobacter]|uniref:hypothetical protein n=1 Tax=Anaeromyxobacter TaxID=161492 RepID=UPI001F595C07|nr:MULTISPECIES: hypothetical protein [unclassified Anaeromyxobacter]
MNALREHSTGSGSSQLVIVLHPGGRTRPILSWLRQLVPAALLVVAAANLPPPASPDVIVLDEDEIASGPLSLADALMRHQRHAHATDPRGGAGSGAGERA